MLRKILKKSAGGHWACFDCIDLRHRNPRTDSGSTFARRGKSFDEISSAECELSPSETDQLGRCELSRLLYGARASLGLALPILILLGGIGLVLGMMTACIGGVFDRIMTGISQVFIAFPTLIIARSDYRRFGKWPAKYYMGGCHFHVGEVYAAYSHLR